MKHLIVFVTAVLALFSLNSCEKVIGEGPVIKQTRTVGDFSELEFGVPGDLEFIESGEQEITIEAQQNIADVIETYVTGNELRIKVKDDKNIRSSERIKIIVKAAGVNSFAVSGSGTMTIDNIQSSDLSRLKLSGSGKIVARKLESRELEARISGSGSIEVMEGILDHEDINISGSGNVNFEEVVAAKASTQTSGSGNIRLNVSDELDVRISGSGDVFYRGSPKINVSVSGSGRLIRL